jgi:hypothetical protein
MAAAARAGCIWRRFQGETRTAVCRKEPAFSEPMGSRIARPIRSPSAGFSRGRRATEAVVSWSRCVGEIEFPNGSCDADGSASSSSVLAPPLVAGRVRQESGFQID